MVEQAAGQQQMKEISVQGGARRERLGWDGLVDVATWIWTTVARPTPESGFAHTGIMTAFSVFRKSNEIH